MTVVASPVAQMSSRTSAGRRISIAPAHATQHELGTRTYVGEQLALDGPLPLIGHGLAALSAMAIMLASPAQGTSPGWIRWQPPSADDHVRQRPTRSARELAQAIKEASGLTNEEIAPLLGVSRRSFQAWLAGEAISARKEARVREIANALERMQRATAQETREVLLRRSPGKLSAYELLQQGSTDAAVEMIAGTSSNPGRLTARNNEPLQVQLDRDQSSLPQGAGKLRRDMSFILRR